MIKNFENLRERYPVFTFEDFTIRKSETYIEVEYHFIQSDSIEFKPNFKLNLNGLKNLHNSKKKFLIEGIAFYIGMVELISYWKACASPKVIIKCAKLDERQIQFFKEIYFHGLGEYFYLNKISTTKNNFLEIESTGDKIYSPVDLELSSKNLIPVGGGKDSITTIELLKEEKENSLLFIVNPRGATLGSAKIAGMEQSTITIDRKIDPKLLELNSKGYLNGHTPFSALLAFQGVFAAIIYGCKNIILSNEDSSSEGNTFFNDEEINHQWSKSFAAEKLLNTFFKEYINDQIEYFSILRPFFEIKIGRFFSRQKKYLKIFRSCNRGSKTNSWCGECPKCLFVFIILSPFLKEDELIGIFNKNLFDNNELESVFEALLDPDKVKPFECVGTKREVFTALSLITRQLILQNKPLPYLLEKFNNNYGSEVNKHAMLAESIFKHYNTENLVPDYFIDNLKKKMEVF